MVLDGANIEEVRVREQRGTFAAKREAAEKHSQMKIFVDKARQAPVVVASRREAQHAPVPAHTRAILNEHASKSHPTGATMPATYVHGYDQRENLRLQDQASTLVELLHSDTAYPAGGTVLEAGCGVGAQTVMLASNSPQALITSIDVSEISLIAARKAIQAAGIRNVALQQANIFNLPFPPHSFDHVFLCFVLEHLDHPVEALQSLKRVLKPGGTITVIEGDHGSTYFHPDSPYARKAVHCLVELQAMAGGNSLIGRALYPLLREAGFSEIRVSPRMVYVDGSKPKLVEGFTKRTFTAMVDGIRQPSLESGLMSEADFDKGIADLYRTAEPDGVFCYTFFKARGIALEGGG
jgi:ubiquinone/menaquinone biosynthesis C-methylase UbiE